MARYGRQVGSDSGRCTILKNAVNTNRFLYDSARRERIRSQLSIPPDAPVIGHVGRFVDAKNHLFLIDVFARIREENSRALLLLVGDGELRPQIEKAIAERNLTSSVIMIGLQDNVWDFYQAMDVFTFPSIYEGLPVSMVEAQAAGLPCCVSSSVPAETAITDLVTFLPLESGADAWAKVIPEKAAEPRRNMLDAIQAAGYDISATSKWLEEYYLKAVNDRGR